MTVKENYLRIQENIKRACEKGNRELSEVHVLGVCKGQPLESIREAYECGVRLMGENRTQEAEVHINELASADIEWHFIGKLQKNKINKILKIFHFIQSVDGVKTLEHIHKRVDSNIDVFIEINIGEESNKSGFTVEGLKKAVNYISNLKRINIIGMMTIPPFFDDPELVRPYFQRMCQLKEEINSKNLPNLRLRHLSMGMSNDYEVAVEEGATILRLGTALFGRRV